MSYVVYLAVRLIMPGGDHRSLQHDPELQSVALVTGRLAELPAVAAAFAEGWRRDALPRATTRR